MTEKWIELLNYNPLTALLEWEDSALTNFVKRDLMDWDVAPLESLWGLQEAEKIISKQLENGAWKYPGKGIDPENGTNYFLLETYKKLRILVNFYGFHRKHPAIEKAAEYLFSCQTDEGDIRGIISNQYMPYYFGVIFENLILAGYADDKRTTTGLEWLISMRQADGGWVVPAQQVPPKEKTNEFWLSEPIAPEKTAPHAHLATGMALRGLAVHPNYRKRPETISAGIALKKRLMKPDKYNDRKAKAYWYKYQYPFWWTNLLTALDTLSRLGFNNEDEDVSPGLDWFIKNQNEDGLWPTGYGSGEKAESNRRWVGLSICRILKEYFGEERTT